MLKHGKTSLKFAGMQSQRNLGFAIVGCGLIGRKRLGTLPVGSLKFAFDLDEERARQLAALAANCESTTDLEKVLGDREVEVVIVSAANAALASITLAAVRAGKHVLVEKPGAVTTRQLSEIESRQPPREL